MFFLPQRLWHSVRIFPVSGWHARGDKFYHLVWKILGWLTIRRRSFFIQKKASVIPHEGLMLPIPVHHQATYLCLRVVPVFWSCLLTPLPTRVKKLYPKTFPHILGISFFMFRSPEGLPLSLIRGHFFGSAHLRTVVLARALRAAMSEGSKTPLKIGGISPKNFSWIRIFLILGLGDLTSPKRVPRQKIGKPSDEELKK